MKRGNREKMLFYGLLFYFQDEGGGWKGRGVMLTHTPSAGNHRINIDELTSHGLLNI